MSKSCLQAGLNFARSGRSASPRACLVPDILLPARGRLALPITSIQRVNSSASELDHLQIPRLDPVTTSGSLTSLRHISHILPTVYKPTAALGMASASQGSIYFATGNKNKIMEVILIYSAYNDVACLRMLLPKRLPSQSMIHFML